ncbi:MAG: hypothetical protein JW959_14455 [Pirellulales bacterium]|nr:hypothetical protein [Pirellulales bacterium]
MLNKIIGVAAFSLFFAAAVPFASTAERTIPEPLPDHPGNIFLAGEEIEITLPDGTEAWLVTDYDGKVVGQGKGGGRIRLGRLPQGYYDVQREGGGENNRRPISIGVLARLKAPTPETSPVACDVGMAWSYPEEKMRAAANLCTLAGLNWVRDRCRWKELEPERAKFAERGRYDESAEAQTAAGLKVLQVNHNAPPWTWSEGHRGRFPADLRDAYKFYRHVAERWRGTVPAIEPWNEADAWDFGNHTGSEIATMQKASYLGLKAGNPKVIAAQNAFCANRCPTTLGDFHANRAWPYFDTFNYHTYDPFFNYPGMGAAFRAVSAGRPMWLTEVNKPVPIDVNDKYHEPSRENLRVQAERVIVIYVLSFHEGADMTFYFYLPDFGNDLQFGLLRSDFTPRPGYLALAAVGRLLADARPLGRLKNDDKTFHAYAFRAKPDGQTRTVLAAWKEKEPMKWKLPAEPIAAYDHLGRETEKSDAVVLSGSPTFWVLPEDAAEQLDLDPPPKKPEWLDGKPSPVVLQGLLPKERVDLDKSAYHIAKGKKERVPIFVYNFGDRLADVQLTLKGAENWKPTLAQKTIRIAGGERIELGLSLDVPDAAKEIETFAVEADCGPAGEAVLSMRFLPK